MSDDFDLENALENLGIDNTDDANNNEVSVKTNNEVSVKTGEEETGIGSESLTENEKLAVRAWEFKELDLLLNLYDALEGVNMSWLCQKQIQPRQQIPIKATFVKFNEKFYVQTTPDETRDIVFSDMVNFGNDTSFVVKHSNQLSAHNFEVEPVTPIEIQTGVHQVTIEPFALPSPPSAQCSRYSRASYLETNLPSFEQLGMFFRRINPDDTFDVSTKEGVVKAMTNYANNKNPLRKTSCPYPLVDDKCVDLSVLQTANRDSDIRNYSMYIADAKQLASQLTSLLGKPSAKIVTNMLIIRKESYEQMMKQNLATWAMYNSQNREVATTAHFFLRALIKDCQANIASFGVNDSTNLTKAATLWLAFYINIPVFFFKATNDMRPMIHRTTSTLKNETFSIVQNFIELLKLHIPTFLPPESIQLQNAVYLKLRLLMENAHHFKFLPTNVVW